MLYCGILSNLRPKVNDDEATMEHTGAADNINDVFDAYDENE